MLSANTQLLAYNSLGKNCREMGNAEVYGHGMLSQLQNKAVLKTIPFVDVRGCR